MIKVEKFEVTNKIKKLIIFLDIHLDNFPKKDLELKRKLMDEVYGLLRLCYMANDTEDVVIKKQYQKELVSSVKFIDFLMDICYEKQIISHKKYLQFGERIENILKYLAGWIKASSKEV